MSKGKRIGKLSDIVIKEGGKIPEVTHIYVTRSFGNPPLMIPWEKVASLATTETVVDIETIKQYAGEPEKEAILLKDHILDKKILDTEGREVEVVYDVKLVLRNNKLYVSDVDLSRYGLLRRIHLGSVANFIYNLAAKIKNQTISWTYIQPLPTQIGSFRGDVKLNILKEKLSEIHPVDLADILEELDSEQRTMLFNQLDTEKASDTLEEIDPIVQRDLISSLKKEKVVQLINEMTPGQAADILAVLPYADAKPLLRSLKQDNQILLCHKFLVSVHIQQISKIRGIRYFHLDKPTFTVRILVNFFRAGLNVFVDFEDFAGDGRVHVGDSLHCFNGSEGLALLHLCAGSRQLHEHDITELALRVVRHSYPTHIPLNTNPFMVIGVSQIVREIHSNLVLSGLVRMHRPISAARER